MLASTAVAMEVANFLLFRD